VVRAVWNLSGSVAETIRSLLIGAYDTSGDAEEPEEPEEPGTDHGLGDTVEFTGIELTLPISDIYFEAGVS